MKIHRRRTALLKIARIASTVLVFAVVTVASTALTARSAQAQDDGFVVAVLPFTSADEGKAKDLQEVVIAKMNELGPYTLIEGEKINDAVGDNGLRPGSPIPDVKSLEIGRGLDAKIIARGELGNRGGSWVAQGTFVDVATRNTQELPEVTGSDVEEVGAKLVEVFNNRNQADKHVIFGLDYIRAENWERAITNFQKALEFDPTMAAAYYYMGEAYLKQQKVQDALTALEKSIEIDPSYISAYQKIGLAYIEQGDTTAARGFFEQLVQRASDNCDVQIAYGYVMANELGQPEKALPAFEKAKQLCPENPQVYQYLAFALPEDRRDEKIANMEKYLELSQGKATDPELLEYLFGLYFTAENYEGAKQAIDQAVQADSTDPNLLLYAGYVRDKLKEYDQSIAFYDRALAINPEMKEAHLGKALAYQELGKQAESQASFQRAGVDVSRMVAAQTLNDAFGMLTAGRAAGALEAGRRAMRLGADGCAGNYVVGAALYQLAANAQGEDKSVESNQRSIDLFRQSINTLQNACGRYGDSASGYINNANQYIQRGETILRNLERAGAGL
jgi:tetratricopeptide (TPR) repeat protein